MGFCKPEGRAVCVWSGPLEPSRKTGGGGRSRVCLFVCLVHGVSVVCGGRRLTRDGPCATRRQAEAVLFMRQKPTPPFAGCQGKLPFQGVHKGLSQVADQPPGQSLFLLRRSGVKCKGGGHSLQGFVRIFWASPSKSLGNGGRGTPLVYVGFGEPEG